MAADEIALHLDLARSTVNAELRYLGLNRLAALEPKATVRRYEPAQPGDLTHLDVKRLARFDKPGHRVTRTRRGRNDGGRLGVRPRLHRRPCQARLCGSPG